MSGSMVYRLRVGDPDAPHLVRYRSAMRAIQARLDNQSYNWIAGIHGAPNWFCWHHQFSSRSPVQARLFLPWHRAYLLELERLLQDNEQGASIPWWDWTFDGGIPQAFSSSSVNGEANPLRRYRIRVPATATQQRIRRFTQRAPGSNPFARFPSRQEVDALINIPDFETFNDELENVHDRIHGWVSGDMGDPTTSAFDPIFYSHHCMIDRLWYLWQIERGPMTFPSSFLDLPLRPFTKTVRDVLDVHALGYEYAGTASDVLVET